MSEISDDPEQQAGSPFMVKLNWGGDTVSGVDYTEIRSANDEVVTPSQSALLTSKRHRHHATDALRARPGRAPVDAYDHIADADS